MIAALQFVRSGGIWIARIYFNVYMDMNLHASTRLIGVVVAVAQLLAIPSALAMPFFSKATGKKNTILLATIGGGMALLSLALLPNKFAASVAFIGLVGISTIGDAAFNVYSQELVDPSIRPLMAGAATTAMGLGVSATAYGGGRILSFWGPLALFVVGVALMAVGSFTISVLPRQKKPSGRGGF